MTTDNRPIKPLGQKAYGSIPHLIGSRRGPGDIGVNEGQHRICTEKCRKGDVIYVQEKLDGSCVSVALINDEIVPLIRAGYAAKDSHREQHRLFHDWAMKNENRFRLLLAEGDRAVGEWLAQAHGTRYALKHDPFVLFDIMSGHTRNRMEEVVARNGSPAGFPMPRLIHVGEPISIESVLQQLEPSGHGALDPVEGAVWRVENNGKVDFLAKFVRQEKVDGCYLEEKNNGVVTWNWKPDLNTQISNGG